MCGLCVLALRGWSVGVGWGGVVQRKESIEVWPEGVPRAGRQPRVRKALVWAWWEGGCPSP